MKGREKSAKKPAGILVRYIKAMTVKLKAQTITISAMKAKIDVETDDPVTYDAGNSFGGCKEKKKAKNRKTKNYYDEE